MIEQMQNRSKSRLVLLILAMALLTDICVMADNPEWCKDIPRPQFTKLYRVAVPSDWFQVYRVKPDVYAFSEPRQYEEVISYLIVGSKNALLFDTGMGIAKIRPVVESITSLPVLVLNSHSHPDHIGGNYEFENILGLNTEFTRMNASGNSEMEIKTWVDRNHVCGTLPPGFDASSYSSKAFRITDFIGDGKVIDLGNRKLTVLLTPGHTPDSLCLLDSEHRILFTGDTFYPGPIYLFAPGTDFQAYVRSVDRLVSHQNEIDDLLTAHNEPLAPASTLSKLKDALTQIQSGAAKPVEKDGLKEFSFSGFSILMK
jgi:glyoxylase-like metal-dependent hydrolase (beta-lactamase superfamily II)